MPPVDPFHRHVRALAHLSGFRRLLTVRLTSQYGDGLFQAALAGSVLFNPAQETNSVKIAVGFAVLLIPYSILGPYVGVFLDRWSRRDIIYLANLVRGALAVVAAALIAIGGLSLEFFVCALLITAINRFFLAGLSAAAPHVVPEPLLVTNNAVASTLGTVAYSLGLGTTAVILHTALTQTITGTPRSPARAPPVTWPPPRWPTDRSPGWNSAPTSPYLVRCRSRGR